MCFSFNITKGGWNQTLANLVAPERMHFPLGISFCMHLCFLGPPRTGLHCSFFPSNTAQGLVWWTREEENQEIEWKRQVLLVAYRWHDCSKVMSTWPQACQIYAGFTFFIRRRWVTTVQQIIVVEYCFCFFVVTVEIHIIYCFSVALDIRDCSVKLHSILSF